MSHCVNKIQKMERKENRLNAELKKEKPVLAHRLLRRMKDGVYYQTSIAACLITPEKNTRRQAL